MKIKGFVINLEHRTDRRESIQANINNCWPELDYEFFKGITPDSIDLHIKEIFDPIKNINIVEEDRARASCRLSHLAVMNNFLNSEEYNKYGAVLIAEDDLKFLGKIQEKINEVSFPSNWDMVFLTSKVIKSFPSKPSWHRIIKSKSLACYILPTHFISTYINFIKKNFELAFLTEGRREFIAKNHGFDHSSHHSEVIKFVKKSRIFAPSPLWTTINTGGTSGFSDISSSDTSDEMKNDYEERINWYKGSTASGLFKKIKYWSYGYR